MNDPAYRFTIIYKDGREFAQEDKSGLVVNDHCHVEDWDNVKIYTLRNRPGDHVLSVNFESGQFSVNDQVINMKLSDLDMYHDPSHKSAIFKPLYGRLRFNGEFGLKTFFYCGWETKIGRKKIKRKLLVDEMGNVFMDFV